jgi:hypothetical protein
MMAARQLEPRGGVPSSGYNTAGFNQSFGKWKHHKNHRVI